MGWVFQGAGWEWRQGYLSALKGDSAGLSGCKFSSLHDLNRRLVATVFSKSGEVVVRVDPVIVTTKLPPTSRWKKVWKVLVMPLVATIPILAGEAVGRTATCCLCRCWQRGSPARSSHPYRTCSSPTGNTTHPQPSSLARGFSRSGINSGRRRPTPLHASHFNLWKHNWHFCPSKDVPLGLAILLLVFITAAGSFNSCSCWGRHLVAGDSVSVAMNVNPRYVEYNRNKFLGIVNGVVGFQLLPVVGGIMVLRWSERMRQEV